MDPTDDTDTLVPDGFAEGLEDGYVDLPFESGTSDPQPLEYASLPGPKYDPEQNWREAQKAAAAHAFGEFAPNDEEATGG